ncbi:hypothetical protein Tco_0122486 [Tanacetum coccineum]
MSTSNQQTLADSRANERPPMLEKGNYIPWESRFRRFLDNKLEDGERMWNSIQNGPYKRPMIPNPDNDQEEILEPLSKMTTGNKSQYIANVKVTSHVRHSRLMDKFDKFAPKEGESLESVYERLTTLVNIMDLNNVRPIPVSINTKFLKCLQPEWSKYVIMYEAYTNFASHDPKFCFMLSAVICFVYGSSKGYNEGEELLRSIESRMNKMTGKGDVGVSLPRTPVRGSQNPNLELDYTRVSEFTYQSDIEVFSMSIKEGKYADILFMMSSVDIDAAVNVIETIRKKFQVDVSNSSPLVSLSTTINVPYELNSIDVAATFEVPLSIVGDLHKLINDIEAGKHDELLSGVTNYERMETLDAFGSICNSIQANCNNAYVIPCKLMHADDSINLNVDESTIPSDPIVQYVDINTKSTSYTGAAGASANEQPKVNSNFCTLVADPIFDGVKVSIPRKVVKKLMTPPIVTTFNVITPTIKKTNDGFQMVGKKKKRKGKSKSTNSDPLVKHNVIYEPKATTTTPKKRATYVGNTSQSSSMLKTTGNSSKKDNLFNTPKSG